MNTEKSILVEALSIQDEYKKAYSSIDEETFNKLISLDPQTDFNRNSIGRMAKQLVLRCYLNGETDILDKSEAVSKAIIKYLADFRNYPQAARNVMNFKNIDQFIDFVNNPTDSFEAANDATVKQNKIDAIYDKYYSDDIERDLFDKLIALDPKTTKDNIGEVAKNLLLRIAKKDASPILNADDDTLKYAIEDYYDSPDLQKTLSLNSITLPQFIQAFDEYSTSIPSPEHEDYIKKIEKYNGSAKSLGFVGSSESYDIYIPETFVANAVIAGATSMSERSGANSYSNNVYGRWCTTNANY